MKNLIKQKNKILLFLFIMIGITFGNAQTIIGTVFSADDDFPLPDVSVVEKGTSNGTTTDFDGNYSMSVKKNATLVFSYIGMKTQEVVVNSNKLDVRLENDGTTLDEVVVVGYGSVRKSDLTGTVTKVDLDKAQVTPTTSIAETLRGRVSGVKVDVGSLRPGGTSTINFRGIRSLVGSNSPIFIVDGIEQDDIDDINQDDIKSIELLKDASAQAVYGSKASNGVILVTTKRGKSNKTVIEYHGYSSTNSIKKNFEVYSAQEFAQLRREAFRTDNVLDEYEPEDFVFSAEELTALNTNTFTDWEKEVVKSGTINNQSLSVSGGGEKTKVFGSLNYYKNNGIIPTSAFTRKTFRLNLNQFLTKKIDVNFNLSLTNSEQQRESQSYNVITLSPLGIAHDDDGNIVQFPTGENAYTSPLWNIAESDNDITRNNYNLTITPKYKITDDLTYKLRVNFSRYNYNSGNYVSSQHSFGIAAGGRATLFNKIDKRYTIENIVTYNKELNDDHKLNLTFVQAMDEHKTESVRSIGENFENESNGYNGINSALNLLPTQRGVGRFSTASFMGRLRYDFKNKYLLTATFRTDGASVNLKGDKWVNTTGFAFAWKAHKESFLEDINQINELKFRVSYGSLPNQAKISLLTLADIQNYFYVFEGETATGFSPGTRLVSDDLDFEVTTGLNVGVDFSLFNNIIRGNANYYKTNTKDLILVRTVPSITGFNDSYTNGGETQNKGFELELTADLIKKENFRWSVSTTYSQNKNELVDLYAKDENGDSIDDIARGYIVGQALFSINQYVFDGIWQEGEDWQNSPQGLNNDGVGSDQPNLGAGSIRVLDLNGRDDEGNLTGLPDGQIDADDRIYTDKNPKWFGSFSTTIGYKGFELLADFYTVQGVKKINPYLADFNRGGTLQGALNGIKVPYYTPENPSTEYPRPRSSSADPYLFSLALKDASYFRLRTLMLAYDFDKINISKSSVIGLKLYLTGTNLFTKTDYFGYSPEVDANGYPDSRSFTLGLKVKL